MRGSRKKFPGSGPMESCVCQGWSEAYLLNWGFFWGGGAILQCNRKFEISRTEEVGWSPDPPPNPSSRSAYVNMEI